MAVRPVTPLTSDTFCKADGFAMTSFIAPFTVPSTFLTSTYSGTQYEGVILSEKIWRGKINVQKVC